MGALSLLIAVPVALILIAVVIAGIRSLGGFRFGHVTLNCPHCGKETPAQEAVCKLCGQPLA